MLVLDTDHLTEYQRGTSVEALRLKKRLDAATAPFATTIITVEEVVRGWMAAIRRTQDPRRQINMYASLQRLFRFFATWNVLEWNDSAADAFESFKRAKIRIGTMDLKIASIALANQATLLTRNRNDYDRVPGLRTEDWLS
ncbi:MAG: type II toxin-antitoxin system VapC family toxin [Planctomycetes bacterium]|nr:type II toxin-antitoxin system VapC family toxin [Planctomycetota bacterium]